MQANRRTEDADKTSRVLLSEGLCLHHLYLLITNIAVVFQFASNNNCQLLLSMRKQKLHLNALDSVFGPYNLFQEGFYEFHRRRRNSAGNVPRRNFMVSNIISQSFYLLNLGLQNALNVFIFSPLVFCAYFCICEGAGRKANFQGAQYILLSPPIDQYLQYIQSYSGRPA